MVTTGTCNRRERSQFFTSKLLSSYCRRGRSTAGPQVYTHSLNCYYRPLTHPHWGVRDYAGSGRTCQIVSSQLFIGPMLPKLSNIWPAALCLGPKQIGTQYVTLIWDEESRPRVGVYCHEGAATGANFQIPVDLHCHDKPSQVGRERYSNRVRG